MSAELVPRHHCVKFLISLVPHFLFTGGRFAFSVEQVSQWPGPAPPTMVMAFTSLGRRATSWYFLCSSALFHCSIVRLERAWAPDLVDRPACIPHYFLQCLGDSSLRAFLVQGYEKRERHVGYIDHRYSTSKAEVFHQTSLCEHPSQKSLAPCSASFFTERSLRVKLGA